MNLRRDGIDYLEYPKKPFDACGLNKEGVEKYAGKVAEATNFEIGSPLTDIVESLGGKVRYLDLDEWESKIESIYVHDEWDFDIILSEYTSPLRDQFTIGHELGHYFLHSNQGKIPLVATRDLTDTRVEWEANWFSAALLMPAQEFQKYWKKTVGIAKIAGHFAVSTKAAEVRAEVLGLNG